MMIEQTPNSGTVGERIERSLMQLIESGTLKAGARVVPAELAVSLNAHPITVQRALQVLARKGALERRPRLGTFVRPQQELFRVAALFGPSLTDESSHFYRALFKALCESRPHPGWQCLPYDGLNALDTNPHRADSALEEASVFLQFLADRRTYPLRGVLGIGVGDVQWHRFTQTPPALNTVRFGYQGEVNFDYDHFGYASVERLLRPGNVRRLVYLRTLPPLIRFDLDGIDRMLRSHAGVDVDVVQFPDRSPFYDERVDLCACVEQVQAWIRDGQVPDAVLVSDDVTMRGLGHALRDCGLARTDWPHMLCWANRGIRFHYGVPVSRYEMDPARIADALTAMLMGGGGAVGLKQKCIGGSIVEDDDDGDVPPGHDEA